MDNSIISEITKIKKLMLLSEAPVKLYDELFIALRKLLGNKLTPDALDLLDDTISKYRRGQITPQKLFDDLATLSISLSDELFVKFTQTLIKYLDKTIKDKLLVMFSRLKKKEINITRTETIIDNMTVPNSEMNVLLKRYAQILDSGLPRLTPQIIRQKVTNLVRNIVKKIFPNYNEVSERVMENLKRIKQPGLEGTEITEIRKQIKKDMDTLYAFKRKFLKSIQEELDNGINNSPTYNEKESFRKMKDQLESIKSEYGEWGQVNAILNGMSEFKMIIDAAKSAIRFERNVLQLLKITPAILNFIKKVREIWVNKDVVEEQIKATKTNETFIKYLKFATPRGFPKKQIDPSNPSSYDEILNKKGYYASLRSYSYELFIRAIKLQVYIAIIQSVKYFLRMHFSEELLKNPCVNEISKQMKETKTENAEIYYNKIANGQIIPVKCLSEYIITKSDKEIASMIALAEFRTLPAERGGKIFLVFLKNFMEINLDEVPKKLWPPYQIYQIGKQLLSPIISLFTEGDSSELDSLENRISTEIDSLRQEAARANEGLLHQGESDEKYSNDINGFKLYLKDKKRPEVNPKLQDNVFLNGTDKYKFIDSNRNNKGKFEYIQQPY
jgi:hypothetical protein